VIYFYSGTPGSGKSFCTAKEIWQRLRLKRDIISTVNINLDKISDGGKKVLGKFTYKPIMDITPEYLYEYAFKNHKKGKEGQTLLILDECQIIFNPREYQLKNRAEWILFFTKHRHLGYKIIMISQNDRLIDRQIRSLFEYEVKHRKVNNRGFLWMLPFKCFAQISYWYGVKERLSGKFIIFKKKYAQIYDSYVMYDDFLKQKGFDTSGELGESGELRVESGELKDQSAGASDGQENNSPLSTLNSQLKPTPTASAPAHDGGRASGGTRRGWWRRLWGRDKGNEDKSDEEIRAAD